MINGDKLLIYLEWHNYKTRESENTLSEHNNWINYLNDWIKLKNIDVSNYDIWFSDDEISNNRSSLSRFLQQENAVQELKKEVQNKKTWIRIGVVLSKNQVLQMVNVSKKTSEIVNDLAWLYEKTLRVIHQSKYWLFNVYYSQNPEVWKYCLDNNVAATQYEIGKQDTAAINRNINLIKQISQGDYVIAYTGKKGFLGCGRVIREFYEEENPSKYYNIDGEPWRQRIGVEWDTVVNVPVKYTANKFKRALGIEENLVMSSYTIFNITEAGYIFAKNLLGSSTETENIKAFKSELIAVNHIHSYITSKGFYYKKEDVKNLYLCMKSKPFVILSGISGTGKTKIIQWFAESMGATEENDQFTLIPVRPDWSDSSDLLGYKDIKDNFKEGPLTKVLKEASQHLDRPYFVLLDEMNLARVEYYFSDLLSVMESRKWQDGEIRTSAVLPEDVIGESLTIPPNVYFAGTVNMDETTHPFSKKVLDRANTIEFGEVYLDHFDFIDSSNETDPFQVHNNQLQGQFLHLKDAYFDHKELIQRVTTDLMEVNAYLKKIGAHVGYRVRDEVCFYMIHNDQSGLMTYNEAFDFQLLQKILPRIAGSDSGVQAVLIDLYQFCTSRIVSVDQLPIEVDEGARFPKSAYKLLEMLRRLPVDGFTSFWLGS